MSNSIYHRLKSLHIVVGLGNPLENRSLTTDEGPANWKPDLRLDKNYFSSVQKQNILFCFFLMTKTLKQDDWLLMWTLCPRLPSPARVFLYTFRRSEGWNAKSIYHRLKSLHVVEGLGNALKIIQEFNWWSGTDKKRLKGNTVISLQGWGQIGEYCWSNMTPQLIILCFRLNFSIVVILWKMVWNPTKSKDFSIVFDYYVGSMLKLAKDDFDWLNWC